MMRITPISALLVAVAAAGCAVAAAGCAVDAGGATPHSAVASAALTTDDVDYAEECTGILTYAENASVAELHSYLPINVVNALVARRAQGPFHSIAEISAVPGIAQARLAQIGQRANQLDFTDVGCLGVFEELAVSYDDEAAIVGYVNAASAATLTSVVRFDPDQTVAQLIARRPFTTLQQVVDSYGIGPATLRSLRNAAIDGPLDQLIAQVNAAHRDVTISLNFDWFGVLFEEPGQPAHLECFGVDPTLVQQVFGSVRPALADGAEVAAQVASSVSYANRFGGLPDATAGLADLGRQVAGQSFFGCYLRFHPDPWSGVDRAFFVNTVTGYRVFTEVRWSE
jgi:DNA uptake protein ComE-like DNA-binding protein